MLVGMKSLLALVCAIAFSVSVSAQTAFGFCAATSGTFPWSSSTCGCEWVQSPTGTAPINSTVTWVSCPSSLAPTTAWFVFATVLAPSPIAVPGFDGDMLLDPIANVIVAADPTIVPGFLAYDFFIPNTPSLIGSNLFAQTLRIGSNGGWPVLSLGPAWGLTIV